jgi:hypothetical protein
MQDISTLLAILTLMNSARFSQMDSNGQTDTENKA